jgi:Defence against restriction A C-terminal
MRNHRYQLTLRPFSFASVPKGFIPTSAKDLQIRAGNYGSIAYPHKLSADIVERYDLKYLGEEPELETRHERAEREIAFAKNLSPKQKAKVREKVLEGLK